MTPENYVGNPIMAGLLKRKNELYAEMVSELKSMSQYLANKDLAAIKSGSGFHLVIIGLIKKAQELEYEIEDVFDSRNGAYSRRRESGIQNITGGHQ